MKLYKIIQKIKNNLFNHKLISWIRFFLKIKNKTNLYHLNNQSYKNNL